MIYPTRHQIVDQLKSISRLAKSRDFASTNFQLNAIWDQVQSLIEDVQKSADQEKAESEGES